MTIKNILGTVTVIVASLSGFSVLAQTTTTTTLTRAIASSPAASALGTADILPLVQGGVTKHVPALGTAGTAGLLKPDGTTISGAVDGTLSLTHTPALAANNGSDFASLTATLGNLSGLPHKANNTALSLSKTTDFPVVIRDGFAAAGDAPMLMYTPSGSACSLNAGAGDGGSQIASSDGKCWLAIFPATGIDPRWFGAKDDGSADVGVIFQAIVNSFGGNPGVVNCGGFAHQYLITTAANWPVTAIHPVLFKYCNFPINNLTSTTDLFVFNPSTSNLIDQVGWGFDGLKIVPSATNITWRHTLSLQDGGSLTKLIRNFTFRNTDIGSGGTGRTGGHDIDMTAAVAGQGLLAYSTIGPNVYLHESIYLHGAGDSITIHGVVSATDGIVDVSKTCYDISNSTAGAGELSINDLNCTAYGGAIFTNTYGTHVRGGVFECQSSHIASATGSFITVIGGQNIQFDAVQVQGAGCSTPPSVLNVDAGSTNVSGTFIEGTNLAGTDLTGRYVIASAASPTTSVGPFNPQWIAYTSELSCGSGTLTTAVGSGRYKWVTGTSSVQVVVNPSITTNGTCAGSLNATLPFTHQNNLNVTLSGRESCSSHKAVVGDVLVNTAAVNIVNYDGTYPGGNGSCPEVQGIYEAQR